MALDGSPFLSDSSIKDFNHGRVGYVADTVEQALLLPRDMVELWNLKKHEVFLSLKRDLAMVSFLNIFYSSFHFLATLTHLSLFCFVQAVQVSFIVEEWVDQVISECNEEEVKWVAAVRALAWVEKKAEKC